MIVIPRSGLEIYPPIIFVGENIMHHNVLLSERARN